MTHGAPVDWEMSYVTSRPMGDMFFSWYFYFGWCEKTIPQNGTCTKPFLFCPESLSHFTQSDNPYDSLGFSRLPVGLKSAVTEAHPRFWDLAATISQGASTEGREKIYAWGIQRLKSESTFFLVFVLHVRGKPGQHFQNRISELHRMCSDHTIHSYKLSVIETQDILIESHA